MAINYYLIKICDDIINDHYVFAVNDELHLNSDEDIVRDKVIFKIEADRELDCNKLYDDYIEQFFNYLEKELHYENIEDEFEEKGISDYFSLADESYLYQMMFLKYSLKRIMEEKLKEYKKAINDSKKF